MKHFINARDRIVAEALDGLLLTSGGTLGRLDVSPNIRVVVRLDWDKSRVAIISGGGAGHEPAHAGFVGPGMLTAAVTGEIFASPSVEAVLAAIRAVTGEAGCLLIVKNYTGDRLNFGLAAERARAEGLDVRMVIVADDIAIPGLRQARGIAGTLFVHKLAGHLSETGHALDEIEGRVSAMAREIVSYGVSLTSCAIPGQPFEERIGPGEAEMGLGIHGETGAERVMLAEATVVVGAVAERLIEKIDTRQRHALIINNLGAVPALEMGVIANAVLTHPSLVGTIELICGPAALMTSLNMSGFSLSLVPLDDDRRAAMLADVGPRAWPGFAVASPLRIVATAAASAETQAEPSDDETVHTVVTAVCKRLIAIEAELNQLDAKAGDGDTGSTIAGGARAILASIDVLPLADAGALCLAMGNLIGSVMGGSSGVLLSIFFTASGEALRSGVALPTALGQGLKKMRFYGGASRGDRTMIDALEPAIEALAQAGEVPLAALAARSGADATARMAKAQAGRSQYIAAGALDGIPDPGAVAVAEAFDAASTALANDAAAPAEIARVG